MEKLINKNMIKNIIIIICLFIGFFSIYLTFSNKKENAQQTITVERVTSNYKLISYDNKKGFRITVKENNTGKVYEDSWVSADCILANQKATPGKELLLTRFSNMNLEDGTLTYFFKGAYEQLCTKLNYNPDTKDNYYKK